MKMNQLHAAALGVVLVAGLVPAAVLAQDNGARLDDYQTQSCLAEGGSVRNGVCDLRRYVSGNTLRFCNETGRVRYLALVETSLVGMKGSGWYTVADGDCATLAQGNAGFWMSVWGPAEEGYVGLAVSGAANATEEYPVCPRDRFSWAVSIIGNAKDMPCEPDWVEFVRIDKPLDRGLDITMR